MLKYLISISVSSAIYIVLTPVWQQNMITYLGVTMALSIFLFIIGMPSYLILNKWLDGQTIKSYFLKVFICMELSFILPIITWRWFQLAMAKSVNLSQLGAMAMFSNGELSEYGRKVVIEDILALSVSAFIATFLVCILNNSTKRNKNKHSDK